MWSGHTSASMIRTPFHSQSCRSIFPISALFSQKNTFLRYFGANTIWYLQFHFVCDKLFTSFILIVNDLLCCFYLCSWQPHSYYTTKESLCHYQLCNSYRTTRLTRGFTIQKSHSLYANGFFLAQPYKNDPYRKFFRNRSMVFSQRIDLSLGDDGRKKLPEIFRAFAPCLQTNLCKSKHGNIV